MTHEVSQPLSETEPSITTPLLHKAHFVAAMVGVSVRTWWKWNAAALIPRPIRIGGSAFWRAEEVKSWRDANCPCRKEWEKNPEKVPVHALRRRPR